MSGEYPAADINDVSASLALASISGQATVALASISGQAAVAPGWQQAAQVTGKIPLAENRQRACHQCSAKLY